jgi:hypothetical protein
MRKQEKIWYKSIYQLSNYNGSTKKKKQNITKTSERSFKTSVFHTSQLKQSL